MADERSLSYEINLGAEKAADDVEKLKDELDEVVENLDEAEAKSKYLGSALSQAGKIGAGSVGGIGDSLNKDFGGAVKAADKRASSFVKNMVVGAKNIGTAIMHPVQTIRKHLVDALSDAEEEAGDLGIKAEETARSIDKMGASGVSAGSAIEKAITKGLKAFLGVQAIKKATQLITNFISTTMTAAQQAEVAEARFNALFSDPAAAQWVENYADATKTRDSLVQTWMADIKAFLDMLGYSDQSATQLSKSITVLGTDIAKAFHIDAGTSITAIMDALGGDFKSLHSIGIAIDENDLKQAKDFIYKSGEKAFKKNLDKLTEPQYATVALQAILDKTQHIQEKAIQEADTVTGASDSLKQAFDKLVEAIGTAFGPATTGILNTLAEAIVDHTPGLTEAAKWVAGKLEELIPYVKGAVEWIATWVSDRVESGKNKDLLKSALETGQLPAMDDGASESYNRYIAEEERKMRKFDESWLGKFKNWINSGYDYSKEYPNLAGDGSSVGIDKELWQRHGDAKLLVDTWDNVTNFFDKVSGKTSDGTQTTQEPREHGAVYNALNDFSIWYLDKAFTLRGWIEDAGNGLWNWVTRTEQSADETTKSFDMLSGAADVLIGKFGAFDFPRAYAPPTGAQIPENARGTDNFTGGWTRINEEGGELAFLPGGSAIIPADKTDRIMNTNQKPNITFAPVIQIEVGSADAATTSELERRLEAMIRRLYNEMQNEEIDRLAVQNSYGVG